MDGQNSYTVYIHTNIINNKKYVGLTRQTVEQRWQNGQGYKYCTLFNNAIKKYGWQNFSHEIVATGLSEEEACELERELIRDLHTCDKEYGYNIFEGGNTAHQTEDTKRRISEAQLGIPKPDDVVLKMRRAQASEETKTKISAALKGRKLSEETKAKMRNRTRVPHKKILCVETGVEYSTFAEAACQTGACASVIRRCCNGRGRSSGGLTWQYVS